MKSKHNVYNAIVLFNLVATLLCQVIVLYFMMGYKIP